MRLPRSTSPGATGILFRIVVCLFVGLPGAGCGTPSNERVEVQIAFDENAAVRSLTDVSVIVGGDKFFWHQLAAGRVEAVTLRPGPQDERQLTLLYTLDGRQKSWDGPSVASGTDYRIEIHVQDDGAIAYRHCILPCNLD